MSYRYENLYIMHYGVGHDKGGHSGRYPWGSGENPYGGKGTARMDRASKSSAKARAAYSVGKWGGAVGALATAGPMVKYELDWGVSPSSGIRQLGEMYSNNNREFKHEVKNFIKSNKKELDTYLLNSPTDPAEIADRFSRVLQRSYAGDKKLYNGITSLNNIRHDQDIKSVNLIKRMADEWDFKTLYDGKHLIDSKKNINKAKEFIGKTLSKSLPVRVLPGELQIPADVYDSIINMYFRKNIMEWPTNY